MLRAALEMVIASLNAPPSDARPRRRKAPPARRTASAGPSLELELARLDGLVAG